MGNWLLSIFNFGNSTQVENTIIHSKVDTLNDLIKKKFFEGKFSEAFDSLDSAIMEHNSNSEATYKLLLVKLKFLIDCRRFNEANEIITVFEKEKRNDLQFNELKLTMMSLNQNSEEFFAFAEELRIKTPNSNPKGHFEIVYYLNSKQLEKAKETFEKEIKNEIYKDKLYLIGGHIYSNEYRDLDSDSENFEKADTFYKLALEHTNLDFLEKLQIDGFYATYFMNNQFRDKINTDNNLKDKLLEYKSSLNILLNNKQYFDKNYVDSLIDNYLYSLISLGLSEEYITFYESISDYSIMRHYLTYCEIKGYDIDHKKCQSKIFIDNLLDDILVYISLIDDRKQDKDKKIVLDFFTNNKKYIYKNAFTVYMYIKGIIYFKNEIDNKLIKFVNSKKYENLEYILTYFEISLYLSTPITDIDKEELFKKAQEENLTFMRLYQSIIMLKRVNSQKSYLDLVIEKQNTFRSLIKIVLENICYEDKNLLLPNYDSFVTRINNPNLYAGLIGNIYSQHDDLNNAFKYFYLEFKKQKNVNVATSILHLSQIYYQRFTQNLDVVKQNEVYNFILGKLDELEIDLLIALFGYGLIIKQDSSSVFPSINQYLLRENIQEISNDIHIKFSDIHISTMTFTKDLYQKMILIDTNLCLEKDGKTYIKDIYEINSENIKNYGFLTISEDDYNLKKQDKSYKECSLFHRISGVFTFNCNNPKMVTMDIKNDFSELFNLIEEHKQLKIKMFENFNEGKVVTFQNLAENDYKKYFTLIPKLLDSNYNFDSGKYNYQPIKIQKILTLSSIILLDKINYLDDVLEREDIYLQRTLIRFILSYKQELDENTTEIPDFDSKDCQFTLFLETNYFTEKQRLISLFNKLIKHEKVIEDDKENLPIKEFASRILKDFGLQEYHALAYAYNYNFQIITEDKTFLHFFKRFDFNLTMLSNSIVLLNDLLSVDDSNYLKISLHKNKYKPLFEDKYINILIRFMKLEDINNLYESEKDFLKEVVNDYGILDDLKKKFDEVFNRRLPLAKFPTKTHFGNNVDKLLNIINSNE